MNEFQFIKDYFKWEKILCTSQRKIIAAETDNLVFRCSYLLSNQGLEKFLQNENVPVEYQKTNMDYLVERYPWTPITEDEYIYCKNDVVGLHMAMQRRINNCANKDINNLPLTSTGYVRKVCRKAINESRANRSRFKREALDLTTYNMLTKAFRGGNTHANRYKANKVQKNVGQKDVRSEYPTFLIIERFPTKFFDMQPFNQKEFDYYLKNSDRWAMIFEASFKNLKLKDEERTPVPYISTSKCHKLEFKYNKKTDEDKRNHAYEVDNGRILSCKGCSMIITETDFKIIKDQYTWTDGSLKISKVKVSKKKFIPKELRDKILEFYYNKTTLKQEEDDPDFDEDKAYLYNLNKSLLNSTYGMHVSKILRSEYKINNTDYSIMVKYADADVEVKPHCVYIDPDINPEEQLAEYYTNFSNFLSYQVGIWVTCYSREWLQRGIKACEREVIDEKGNKKIISDLVYCDTDSCKFINPKLHEASFEALNQEMIKRAEKRGAYVDYKGKRYHLGIWCDEGVAKKFITFGAKKYIYSTPDGFKITISGVPKKAGKKCIIEAIKKGKIKDPFDVKKGFVFHAVKNTSQYNDLDQEQSIEIDGHIVYYGSNIAIYPASYSLGLTYEYELLLEMFKEEMK